MITVISSTANFSEQYTDSYLESTYFTLNIKSSKSSAIKRPINMDLYVYANQSIVQYCISKYRNVPRNLVHYNLEQSKTRVHTML